ncbi:MAG: hypothetical protein KDJ24_19545 [Gammaproteobacteria bacterium]|nr:hypothetical protein [Gammaproteobacteria bacterium]
MTDDVRDTKLSALYGRTPRDEPSAVSDRAIIAAAHAAATRRQRNRYVPWALAATLVLGVGIGWRVMLQAPEVQTQGASSERVERASRAPAPAAEMAADAAAEMAPASEPLQDKRRERAVPPPASAPALSGMTGALPAPAAMGKAMSSPAPAPAPACERWWPEQRDDKAEWERLLAEARARGDEKAVECLLRGMRERF